MFVKPIENVTVPIGREAILECVVQNLNSYKVAWLRVDTQTILTLHNHVITKNHRVGVTRIEQKTWYLHIRDLQESDKGWYMCQINTDPMLSQVGFLNVVDVPVTVSPDILDYPTSTDMVIDENGDVSLRCAASGSPRPVITWKKENGQPIILSNGTEVPPSVWIEFQLIGAYKGQKVTLECHSQAFPKSINYWTRDNGDIIPHSTKFVPEIIGDNYKVHMKLSINYLGDQDFGVYKCVSKNSQGDMEGSINVYKIPHPNQAVSTNKDKSAVHDKVDDLSYRPENNNEKDKMERLLKKDTHSGGGSNNFRSIGRFYILCKIPLLYSM
ncbi:hypothetical protein ABEB36_003797 [Hypothenemus hampei]|uniref:Ig-like domain-containing protein n=1 Tax=Hypothenemus hampei TaxID=57062 RepID=A0ABD1F160_HYPHA